MAKKPTAAVYKIVEVVGVSETSWEEAGRNAVETASSSLRDLRVAEVTKMDMKVERGRSPRFAPASRSPSNTKPDPWVGVAPSLNIEPIGGVSPHKPKAGET